jgi:hypothetical protein
VNGRRAGAHREVWRLRARRKALKGERELHERSGMKQGRGAGRGASRQEGEKPWRRNEADEAPCDDESRVRAAAAARCREARVKVDSTRWTVLEEPGTSGEVAAQRAPPKDACHEQAAGP